MTCITLRTAGKVRSFQELREAYAYVQRVNEIIKQLRAFKGPYLGDGIQPNVNAHEIADILDKLLKE